MFVLIWSLSFLMLGFARALAEGHGGWAQVGYEPSNDRWSEAVAIIGNGLLLVFAIMALLASITWIVGRMVQWLDRRQAAGEASEGDRDKE